MLDAVGVEEVVFTISGGVPPSSSCSGPTSCRSQTVQVGPRVDATSSRGGGGIEIRSRISRTLSIREKISIYIGISSMKKHLFRFPRVLAAPDSRKRAQRSSRAAALLQEEDAARSGRH